MQKRDLRHINIYQDKKGHKILYDVKKKEGLIIPEEDVSKIAALQYRVWMMLAIGIILYFLFQVIWWVTALITITLLIAGEVTYRRMLSSYTIIPNYVPSNILDKSIDAYKQKPRALLVRIGLYSLLGVLLIWTVYGQPITSAETQVILVVSVFAFVNAGYHLFVLIRSRK